VVSERLWHSITVTAAADGDTTGSQDL